MDGFEKAIGLLPQRLRREAEAFRGEQVEEIRLRTGHRATLLYNGCEQPLTAEAVSEGELQKLLEQATGASLHSSVSALAEGYLSYRGLRVGVCGTAVRHGGQLSGFRNLSSAAIRIPRECRGICDGLLRQLYRDGFENTLLISRPGGGKTTALRELIRRLSDGGTRLGVVDERNELSATEGAKAQFDLGAHSDVLVGVPKAEGAMMLLRGMNPQVLAVDEISNARDVEAMAQLYGCGAGLLASAHASGWRELNQRPIYRELLRQGIFKILIVISGTGDKRRYVAERLQSCECLELC